MAKCDQIKYDNVIRMGFLNKTMLFQKWSNGQRLEFYEGMMIS